MRKSINSYLAYSAICIFVMAALSSCIKSREGRTDLSGLQPIVMIRESGLAQFGKQALTFPGIDEADTAYFRINYAAKDVAPTDITVTLGYDENALTAYNSTVPESNQYEKMPDSIYSFTSTTVTIKAGQSFSDPVPFVVFPTKIDPVKNYMLPISITDAKGVNISGNFGTLYYHLIGNPIAGSYNWDWTRWNATDTTGDIVATSSGVAIFAPDDPTTVEVPSGYYTHPRYVISFTNNNGVLSDFQVSLNKDDVDKMFTPNGIAVANAPAFLIADPVNGRFRITYSVSSGGSPRAFIDDYQK
jgi:hypothetical protein